MNKNELLQLLKRYHNDKRQGIKRGPLHLLKECLEEAGVTTGQYNGMVRQFGNAPSPVLISPGKGSTCVPTKHFRKSEVLAYIEQCRKAKGETA